MPSPIERSVFGKTPALKLSAYLLLGAVIAHWFHCPLVFSLPILLVLLVSALLCDRVRNAALIGAVILAGSFLHQTKSPHAPAIARFTGNWVIVDGVVSSELRTPRGSTQFELNVERIECGNAIHRLGGKILMWSGPVDLAYGDRIRVSGLLQLPPRQKNPAEFDYGAYLERQGVFCTLNCSRGGHITLLQSRSGGNLFVKGIILPLKRFFTESYAKTLRGETRAFVESITFGVRENLSGSTRTLFTKTGVYHILAVSGLHVGIVGFILFTFLSILRIPRRAITATIIASLVVYMFIIDLRPSVVRATIMTAVLLTGLSMERNVNLLNLLGVSLLIILLVDPLSPFDVSFQLSFAAAAAIIAVVGRLRTHRKTFLYKWLCMPVIVSLAAQGATAPIVAYHFFRLPLLTALANLFVIPLATCSIALGFVSSVATLVSVEVSRIFSAANWLVVQGILRFIRILATFKHVDIVTGRPSTQFMAAYFLLFLLALHAGRVWVRKVLLFGVLITVNLFTWYSCFAAGTLRTTFLSLRGSACIVETPRNRTILIDGGSHQRSWERVIAPSLWEKGIRKIDLLLLTARNSPRAAQSLLDNFEIGLLIGPPVPSGSEEYLRLLRSVRERQFNYVGVMAGDVITVDGVELRFHYPTASCMEFATVLELNYVDFTLLWWGKGVRGRSTVNLDAEYDAVWFGSPAPVEMNTDLAVAEDSRHLLAPFENLLITERGAVEVISDGATFRVEQVLHR